MIPQESLPPLPDGWVWTNLGEISIPIESADPTIEPDKTFTYVDIASIDNKRNVISHPKVILGRVAPSRARQRIKEGDILFSTVRTYLRNVALVTKEYEGQVCSTGFCVIRPAQPIPSRLVFYYVLTDSFIAGVTPTQTGILYPATRDSTVFDQPIPIAPLPEQRRMVSKIEESMTKLDTGVEALRQSKAGMAQYKQAILKYAFQGLLTKVDGGSYDYPSEIEQLLGTPSKERLGSRPLDGNTWTRISNVAISVDYGTSEKATSDKSGIPVLAMGNIKGFELDFTNTKFFPADWSALRDFTLQPGDLLFNRTNSPELVGKSAVYKERHPKSVFASYLIRVKLDQDIYNPAFLCYFINSVYGKRYIKSVVSQQVGQANVNGTKLSVMPIPLVPRPVQDRITQEVELQLSLAENTERVIMESLREAEHLRQSVLHRAFSGKLVEQDPTDEPAVALLKRIRDSNFQTLNKRVRSRARKQTRLV